MPQGLDGPVFRDATREDAPALAHLDRLCFPARPYPERLIGDHVSRGAPCHVAEGGRDRELWGFAMVDLHPETGDGLLLTIDVVPAMRRRGLGTALLGLCARSVVARGGEIMVLTAGSRNETAQALYAKVGFEEAGAIEGYYEDDDAIVMLHRHVAELAARAPQAPPAPTAPMAPPAPPEPPAPH